LKLLETMCIKPSRVHEIMVYGQRTIRQMARQWKARSALSYDSITGKNTRKHTLHRVPEKTSINIRTLCLVQEHPALTCREMRLERIVQKFV